MYKNVGDMTKQLRNNENFKDTVMKELIDG
jgi:hypothetical protein